MHRSRLGYRSGLLLAVSLLLALPALAQKFTTQPGGVGGAVPTFRIIAGNPLTVHVGSDGSFQVFNAAVPGQGQIYPGQLHAVADMGIFADFGGILYAPNFNDHVCGSASGGIGTHTPWTQVSLSPAVTGTGTTADPFTVVIVLDAGTTGIRLTATITYVNTENLFRITKVFTSTAAASVTMSVFEGADIFLAGSDSGIPFLAPASNSPGGQVCSGPSLHDPVHPDHAGRCLLGQRVQHRLVADRGGRALQHGGGAGLHRQRSGKPVEPHARVRAAAFTINSAASFGEIPPIAGGPTANVPTLDTKALVILAVLLAAIGFVVVRRLLG